jgi:Concanavalin A-like lectin/glucanases superfamily
LGKRSVLVGPPIASSLWAAIICCSSSNQLTIDAWIKPDFSQQNALDTVLTKRDGCGDFGVSYNLNVIKFDPAFGGGHAGRPIGQLVFAMSNSSGSPNILADSGTTIVPNDSQFHHVAGTYDGSTMNVYLDGELVGQASRTGPILGTTSAPVISHHGGTCPQRAAAAIDEIEFYDRGPPRSRNPGDLCCWQRRQVHTLFLYSANHYRPTS